MVSAPICTVVVATFNGAERIGGAIDSVLAQTRSDLELIVVDDGSTDDTAARVLSVSDPRVRLIRQANGGISAARNAGAAAASGRLLAFLDDDDRLLPHWLDALAGPTASPEVGLVSGAARLVDSSGRSLGVTPVSDQGPVFGHVRALFLPASFVVKRELFAASGGYTVGLQCSHVTELMLRLLPIVEAHGLRVDAVEEPVLVISRRDPDQRPESSPAKLLQGATYVLDRHRPSLARAPWVLADYYAIVGVSAARLGDFARARRALFRAFLAWPRSWRHASRLALSCVPPIADRVWKAHLYRTAT